MQKWKIIQILIKLPPEKLVTALLLLFIAASLTSNSIVAAFFISSEKQANAAHKVEIDYYKKIIKSKDSIIITSSNRHLDFVEEQLKIGFKHEREIDSLEQVKKQKR